MSEERFAKLESTVRALRARVDEVDRGRGAELAALRYAVFASVAAGALLALTATTWRSYRGEDPELEDVTTLWGMAPEGWQGMVAFGLVLVLSVGTIAVFLADTAGRITHLVFAGIAALTVVAIMLVGQVDPEAWYYAEEAESGPGRWLALLTALVLAIAHLARGAEVHDR